MGKLIVTWPPLLSSPVKILSKIMKLGENFIQHTLFRFKRGQENQDAEFLLILVLHVKIPAFAGSWKGLFIG